MAKHRGEVSFPGGMEDPVDGGELVETALREAEEELGIQRGDVEVWGKMTQLPSKAKGAVLTQPFLAFCSIIPSALTPNPDEVESVFYRSISSLADPANVAFTQFRTQSPRFDNKPVKQLSSVNAYTMPVYPPLKGEPPEHKIWGLTAMILHQALKILLTKDLYQLDLKVIS